MEFEWDPAKNRENRLKHGISFEQAIEIWDAIYVEVSHIAHSVDGEQRGATMGWIGQKLYVAIWTQRGVAIRLISVRRARKDEETVFFEKIHERE